MKLKTVWLWPGLVNAALLIAASAALSGAITYILRLGTGFAMLIGVLLGWAAGSAAVALWPLWRFEWTE